MGSSLEEEFALQLGAAITAGADLAFDREYQFAASLGRKWRADFVVWRQLADGGRFVVEDGPLAGIILQAPSVNFMERGPATHVLVEVQGVGPQGRHGGWDHIESDCEKFSTAAALGWRVLPVTGKMVRNGTALALVEAALGLKPLQIAPAARKPKRPKAPSKTKPSKPAAPQARALACLPDRVLRAAGLK